MKRLDGLAPACRPSEGSLSQHELMIRVDILERRAWRIMYGTLTVATAVACFALAVAGMPFMPLAVLSLVSAVVSTLDRFVAITGVDAELTWSLLGHARAVRFVLGEVGAQRSRSNANYWWLVFRDSDGKGRCHFRVSEARMQAIQQHSSISGIAWIVAAPGERVARDRPRA